MTITARAIADSFSLFGGSRLTTFELRYPRFIHSEVMTHRVFSRNASSSRAIPVKKLIEDVMNDPAMPIHWGKNQKGMQAEEELSPQDIEKAKNRWLAARDQAVEAARELDAIGAHKQIVNRILEPFSHITVTVTATQWSNFFALRCHPDAQPEIQALGDAVWKAREESEPALLDTGQWHLPYITRAEIDNLSIKTNDLIKMSVARCARTSYLTHDKKEPSIEQDLALYDRLVGSEPLHASPAEHQATPDMMDSNGQWRNRELHGNLVGWIQYRKTLPNENQDFYSRQKG
jgi:thymidylate synthase ThyX